MLEDAYPAAIRFVGEDCARAATVGAARLATAKNGGVFPSLAAHPLRSVLGFCRWGVRL